MARIKQKTNGKGSLKCIQALINNNPDIINTLIKAEFQDLKNDTIIWKSPLKTDQYAEYRDDDFIKQIDLVPAEIKLDLFWPKRGPQWDALAITETKKVILVEAKANAGEINSQGTKSKDPSRGMINNSLNQVKDFLKVESSFDWSGKYYQYTNRIAHLYYLRECGVDAYLVNIYFINDKHKPTIRMQFEKAINNLKDHLGLGAHQLDEYTADLFIHANDLQF